MLCVAPNGYVVTGSADRTVKIFDLSKGLTPIATMNTTDAVFSGEVQENLILAGCGDGNVLAFDITQGGECVWGYGADEAGAIHAMKVTPDLNALITGGDSGAPLKMVFSGF